MRGGTSVPEPASLKLGNDAIHFKRATVLYADLDGSTDLVENKNWAVSGEVYKAFLYATSRLIRRHGGSIVSYDGDRVVEIFVADSQSNDAVACALEINYAIRNIVQAEILKGWTTDFKIRHIVGVDTSEIHAARTCVRGTTISFGSITLRTSPRSLPHFQPTIRHGSRNASTIY